VDQDNDTIAILLTNRVHPSRSTVSTNTVRRPFARLVADSIPVEMQGHKKEKAWFAGYGDQLNRSLTAEVDVKEDARLSFDTWYRIEKDSDFGHVETSPDGETWTAAGNAMTGTSDGWSEEEVSIPAGTKFIRFNYETDASVNYRGWYVKDIQLKTKNGHKLKTHFTGWTERSY
jgi:serine-type D-Ala-D-Ala carboxypeptidase